MSQSFTKCLQCKSTESTITKEDLKAAGLPSSDKRVTRRFCSIACYELYTKRVGASHFPRFAYGDDEGGYDDYDSIGYYHGGY
jgi:hypothetical protein